MAEENKVELKLASTTVADLEEMRRKIRKHRLKIVRNIMLFIVALAGIAAGIYIYMENKEYTDYKVISETDREDTATAQYLEFSGNILRYSNDGAFYTDISNNLIWNQTYEFKNPIVDICGTYVAIADKGGTDIYILDTQGLKSKVETIYPVVQVEIARQGTIGVLMEANGTNYLQLYGKDGRNLAEGELHIENSGTAMDIALSQDAKKMGISMLDVNDGSVKTTVAFYNYDSVGQNQIDNIVASYSYENTLIPQIEFLTNDTMVAFGDDKVLIFKGSQKPEEQKNIELTRELKSIFYDAGDIGLVYGSTDSSEPDKNTVEIYDTAGNKNSEFDFNMQYGQIQFLQNGEVCINNSEACAIYKKNGFKKFTYKFKTSLCQIISVNRWTDYIFIINKKTQKVRIK